MFQYKLDETNAVKEYEVLVTTKATVYVEADNEQDAIRLACEQALNTEPDSINAEVISTCA